MMEVLAVLPVETILGILDELDAQDLGRCRLVSKRPFILST